LFTWTANLWPGLRAPLALAGLAGAILVVASWRASRPVMRRLLIFAVAWYLLHELPPMKPYPGGARHMTVMAAVFAIFAAFTAEWVANCLPRRSQQSALTAIIAAIALPPALFSYRLVQSAPNDTQLVARRVAAILPPPVAWAMPATVEPSRELPHAVAAVEQSRGVVVLNELIAEEYVLALTLSGQKPNMRECAESYAALMRHPALRVSSTTGGFAFRNAPYRIVALQGDPKPLAAAAARFAATPGIQFELVPGNRSRELTPVSEAASGV